MSTQALLFLFLVFYASITMHSIRLTLSPDFVALGQNAVNTRQEHGGNTFIDPGRKIISSGNMSIGGYNYIDLERGVVDWHTHPKECKSDDMCAVGVPSYIDLVNVAMGSLFGTQAHILFSHDATYVIGITDELKADIKRDKCAFKRFKIRTHHILGKIHESFAANRIYYGAYIRAYLTNTRTLGFTVKVFKPDNVPYVDLVLPKTARPGIMSVGVPLETATALRDKDNSRCPLVHG